MKSKGCALFALFAAAALFVVAGCSDDSSEAFESETLSTSTLNADTSSEESGEESSSSSADTGSDESASDDADTSSEESASDESDASTITADNVAELLQSIGNVVGNSKNEANYWDFASGVLSADDAGGYTFAVGWAGNNPNTSDRLTWPSTSATIASIQGIGAVSTSLLMVSFSSETTWEERPQSTSGSTETGAAKGDTKGTVMASIELANSSYTIPESLKSVTIALENEVWTYN